MNGLLHRLAARAAGTAVSVRSDARLPYGRAAPAWADTTEPEPAAARDAMRRSVPRDTPPPRARRPAPAEWGLPPAQAAAGALPDKTLPDKTLPGPVPPGPALRVASGPADEPEPAPAPPPEQPLLVQAEMPASGDAASLPTARSEPAPGRRDAAPFGDGAEALAGAARAPADPAPLLPPATGRSAPDPRLAPPLRPATGAVPRPSRSPQPADGAADEAAEVHIHIGRIDVTAVREAPPPRRRPPLTPAPMSLDAYLARRGRS